MDWRHVQIASVLLLATLLSSTGCTYHQLRKNTLGQAGTIADLHQQQVLDNLAMFAANPNAVPYFAIPKQGTSEVTDRGNMQVTSGWQRFTAAPFVGDFLFNSIQLPLSAERAAKQNWTLDPINDPKRLELMRCAYQQAVSSCGMGVVATSCPKCQERWTRFYTGTKDGKIETTSVTAPCLENYCWFRVGCKDDLPDACGLVGRYCDTYVWVPLEFHDELAKLTLVILDFAVSEARKLPTKEVVYYLDVNGRPTTKRQSVSQVSATITVTDKNQSVLSAPYARQIEKILLDNNIDPKRLDEFSAAMMIASVQPSDQSLLAELFERSGFLPPGTTAHLEEKFHLLDALRSNNLLDVPEALNLRNEAIRQMPGANDRIQLTPEPIESRSSSAEGLPSLLQLNQLLETVR